MGTEVITYSRIGKEDIRFGKGTFEVVLADGRKAIINEVDVGTILNDRTLSTSYNAGLWIDVRDYGASPSASASTNATAFQAAADAAVAAVAAEIVIPHGIYDFDTGIVQAPSSGQTHINWRGFGGAGANGVVLNYTGTGGTALTLTNNTRYSVKNLSILDGGTGANGILLTSLAAGSTHGPGYFENIFVSGFTNNVHIGSTADFAASEIKFKQLEVVGGSYGVLIEGETTVSGNMNSLNIAFEELGATDNTTASVGYSGPPDRNSLVFRVYGYTGSNNTAEFVFLSPARVLLSSIYAENTGDGRLLQLGPTTPSNGTAVVASAQLENVYLSYPSSPSSYVILFNQVGAYSIRNAAIQSGGIQLAGPNLASAQKGSLALEQMVLAGGTVDYLAGSNTYWNILRQGVYSSNADSTSTFDDKHYLIDTAGTEHLIVQYGVWSSTSATDLITASLSLRVVATADLPAAATAMNGTILIEDGGAGDRNLIIYAGGERFRIDGGTAF